MQIHTLQADLARLGFDCGPLDGLYGRRTTAALMEFKATSEVTPWEAHQAQLDDVKRPDIDELKKVGLFPKKWLKPLRNAMRFAAITPDRLAAFICELAVETKGFTHLHRLSENQTDDELYERFNINLVQRHTAPNVFKIAAIEWLDGGMNYAVDHGRYPELLDSVKSVEDRRTWLHWLAHVQTNFRPIYDYRSLPVSEDFMAPEPQTDEHSDQAPEPISPPLRRLVFLDVQHSGKPPAKMRDRGAQADLNHNGVIEVSELETAWTSILAYHLENKLIEQGYSVIRISDGWYRERHERVNRYSEAAAELGYQTQVYLALHLNSLIGGKPSDRSGLYSSFFFDHRSSANNGPKLAELIKESMTDQLAEWYATPASELSYFMDPDALHQQVADVRTFPASPGDWTKNAFFTIKGVGGSVVAICAEPYFMDQIYHPISEAGMKRAAVALFEGIHAWAEFKEST